MGKVYRTTLQKKTRRPKSGYVYIVRVDRYIKIGFSKNPDRRFKGMETLPWPIEELGRFYSNNASELEIFLQHAVEKFHVNGEWFLLDDITLDSLLSLAEKHSDS